MAEQNGAADLPSAGGALGDSAEPRDSRGSLSKVPPLDITAAQLAGQTAMVVALSAASVPETEGPPSPGSPSDARRQSARNKADKQKLGHRRVREGEVTYKKIQTTTIMGAIQLGISYALGSEASRPRRDVLLSDFYTIETIAFPNQGGQHTPAHHFVDFRFKIYATIGFKYFRTLFGIRPDDFLLSMCNEPLRELTNAGASGSIFYLTLDDEFIVKTVQHKEGELLLKLLPAYFMNLNQNPRTLLPKFFGLYCYQCNSKNIRLVVMNNLLPSSIKIHQRYDLKGSTYKRKASKSERAKRSPTFKDLDFMDHHPEGLMLEATTYNALILTIQKDVRVLESFQIMDYSLLVGVHNLDIAAKERTEAESAEPEADSADGPGLSRSRSINRHRLVAHSTAMESIQAESEPIDDQQDVPPGGIPARNSRGERLLLFLGIIDILQSYRVKKRLEHTFKSMVHDGNTISVHRPDFYAKRFTDFMGKTVFQKIPSPLRHSPSKRKGQSLRMRALDNERKDLEASAEAKTRQPGRPTTSRAPSTPPVSCPAPAPILAGGAQVSLPAVLQDRPRPSPPGRRRQPPPVPPRSPQSLSLVGVRSRGSGPPPPPPPPPPPLHAARYPAGLPRPYRRPAPTPAPTPAPVLRSVLPPAPLESRESLYSALSHQESTDLCPEDWPSPGVEKIGAASPVARAVILPLGSTGMLPSRCAWHGEVDGIGALLSVSSVSLVCAACIRHAAGGLQQQVSVASSSSHTEQTSRHVTQVTISGSAHGDDKQDSISVSDIQLEAHHDSRSTLSVDSVPAAGGGQLRHVTWTPPMSVEGSTPTWTEGTPSFTESSSSGDIGCPTTPVKSLNASRDSGVNTMPYTKLNNSEHRTTSTSSYTETEMGAVTAAADSVCIHVAGADSRR